MEVHFTPDVQAKLDRLVTETGRSADVLESAWIRCSQKIQSRFPALLSIAISCGALLAQSAPVRYTMSYYAGGQSAAPSDTAALRGAYYTATGSKGEIYLSPDNCVFRIAADGSISRYAGICTQNGKSDDGGPATEASLWLSGIATDPAGNLYILEWGYYRIRKVTPDGIISTIAGTGVNGCTGDGGLAVNAGFGKVYAIATDTKGTIYANCDNSVRKISPDGKITTFYVLNSGYITALACDQAGNVYVMADPSGEGTFGIIHRVSPDGKDVVFGGGGYSHDDGIPALQSWIASSPMAIDASGNVYMVDGGSGPGPSRRPIIRKIDGTTGIITKFAGNGALGTVGDGGPLSAASLNSPGQLAIDSNGNLVFPDSGRVRRILLKAVAPKIELVVSIYTATQGDGPRATATFGGLAGIARDKSGNLYVADTGYSRIRKIGTDDMVTTIAGTASWGFDGDGDATAHSLFSPFGIDFDSQGNLWIADSENLRLRKARLPVKCRPKP
jgi:sugar lactone lactonase YvrE